ncbi:MAG TPA: hypothetical protein GX507_10575 [Clostridia bacterium]|nr:hypothetical protein [Clostridia bacterium]
MLKLNVSGVRSIYLYAVSFATLLILIFSAASAAEELMSLFYPEAVYSPGPLEIKMRWKEQIEAGKDQDLTEEMIDQQIEHERSQAQRNAQNQHARRLAKNGALFIVSLPVYISHWRKAQEESRNGGSKQE